MEKGIIPGKSNKTGPYQKMEKGIIPGKSNKAGPYQKTGFHVSLNVSQHHLNDVLSLLHFHILLSCVGYIIFHLEILSGSCSFSSKS
jgi:ribosome modulation factor